MPKLLILMSLLSLLSSSANAEENLRLSATSIKINENKELQITYTLGCGESFVAFVIHPIEKDAEIGVLLNSSTLTCAKLARPVTTTIPAIHAGSFRRYFSVEAPSMIVPLEPIRFDHIHSQPTDRGDTWKVQAIFKGKCGQSAGILIGPNKELSLGYLEYGSSSGECPSKLGVFETTLRFLAGAPTLIRKFSADPPDPEHTYTTRITALKPNSLQRLRNGQFSFSYLRRCDEAPLGPMVHFAEGRKVAYWSMIVARFSQGQCAEHDKRFIWSSFTTSALAIPDGFSLHWRQPKSSGQEVDLITPYLIDQAKGQASFLSGCAMPLGIAALEHNGNILIALTAPTKSPGLSRCGGPMRAFTYALPQVDYKNRKLVPLKLANQW